MTKHTHVERRSMNYTSYGVTNQERNLPVDRSIERRNCTKCKQSHALMNMTEINPHNYICHNCTSDMCIEDAKIYFGPPWLKMIGIIFK
jgi:acetyl-CoA carboxylase beta subunit